MTVPIKPTGAPSRPIKKPAGGAPAPGGIRELVVGATATWRGASADIPTGTVGEIIEVHKSGRWKVQFPCVGPPIGRTHVRVFPSDELMLVGGVK